MFFDVGEVQKQTGFSPVLSLQRLSRDCYRGWVATAQPALRATALPLLEAALSFPGGSHSYPLYHHDALTEYLKSYFFHFCFLPRLEAYGWRCFLKKVDQSWMEKIFNQVSFKIRIQYHVTFSKDIH